MARTSHAVAAHPVQSPPYSDRLYTIKVQGRIEGQVTINLFHYLVGVEIVAGVPKDITARLVTKFLANCGQEWDDCVSTTWTREVVSCRLVSETLGTPIIQETVSDVVDNPGNVVGDPLPSLTAMLVSKRYRLADGSLRSAANYIAGVTEPDTQASFLGAAQYGLFDQFVNLLANQLTPDPGDTDWTIATPGMRVAIKPPPLLPPTHVGAACVAFTSDSLLSTCRRRKFGRGV